MKRTESEETLFLENLMSVDNVHPDLGPDAMGKVSNITVSSSSAQIYSRPERWIALDISFMGTIETLCSAPLCSALVRGFDLVVMENIGRE